MTDMRYRRAVVVLTVTSVLLAAGFVLPGQDPNRRLRRSCKDIPSIGKK